MIGALVPVERVRPLARWMVAKYGRSAAAELAGLPLGTLDDLVYSRRKRYASRRVAEALVEVVLAHRRPARSVWDTWEVERRLPTAAERLLTARGLAAEERRRCRRKARMARSAASAPQ